MSKKSKYNCNVIQLHTLHINFEIVRKIFYKKERKYKVKCKPILVFGGDESRSSNVQMLRTR